jgi:hypothetical protein
MAFHEKLHLLMNITNTSNSALARSLGLDASYISRLARAAGSLRETKVMSERSPPISRETAAPIISGRRWAGS